MTNLLANWPAPAHIKALTTSRKFGVSDKPYDHNNLALHVGDEAEKVQLNRRALQQALALPGEPAWLEQTHSNHCVIVEEDENRTADAAITRTTTTPLAIMTADCLPIMLCNRQGTEIAAIHAGWRGLKHGIITETLKKMQHSPADLLAWVGPAICQTCYEVGPEVHDAFTSQYPYTESAFHFKNKRLYASLAHMAELMLQAAGITAVYQSGACTYESVDQFYSYRRSAHTGRMATLIWFDFTQQDGK